MVAAQAGRVPVQILIAAYRLRQKCIHDPNCKEVQEIIRDGRQRAIKALQREMEARKKN